MTHDPRGSFTTCRYVRVGDLVHFNEEYYGIGYIGVVILKEKIRSYSDDHFMLKLLTYENEIKFFSSTNWPVVEIMQRHI